MQICDSETPLAHNIDNQLKQVAIDEEKHKNLPKVPDPSEGYPSTPMSFRGEAEESSKTNSNLLRKFSK